MFPGLDMYTYYKYTYMKSGSRRRIILLSPLVYSFGKAAYCITSLKCTRRYLLCIQSPTTALWCCCWLFFFFFFAFHMRKNLYVLFMRKMYVFIISVHKGKCIVPDVYVCMYLHMTGIFFSCCKKRMFLW